MWNAFSFFFLNWKIIFTKKNLRHIIEGVDDDQTQSDKKDNSGRNHISGNQKAYPRHDYEYSSGQVHIEQIRWNTPWKSDF